MTDQPFDPQTRRGRSARPLPVPVRLRDYPGVTLSVALDGADPVGAALDQAISGWHPAEQVLAPGALLPGRISRIKAQRGGRHASYRAESPWLEHALDDLGLAMAACAVIADLSQDFFESRPGCLALHCGAVRFGAGLVALTGPARAGKSTLTARLTAEPDVTVFCDDVLPVLDDGLAYGLGIAPRLRLPLPASVAPGFRAHVATHLGPRDARYGYVCGPNIAPHGSRAPLLALVVLDRRDDLPAGLHGMPYDQAITHLLTQNMTDLMTAGEAVARLSALAGQLTCLRLVYRDLEDAVALLRAAFAGPQPIAPDIRLGPPLPPMPGDPTDSQPIDPDLVWQRDDGATIQHQGDAAFLWRPGLRRLWHLNRIALAVWTMLEIPGSARDLASVLTDHLAGAEADRVLDDIRQLIAAMAAEGLVQPAGG